MQKVMENSGTPGSATKSLTLSDDNAHPLSDITGLELSHGSGTNVLYPEKVILTVESNAIRCGVGTINQSLGHIVYPTERVEIQSKEEIIAFRFANETAGANATVQATTYWNTGG